ncbi:MAG: AbrB family transcriptional regulator [Proteobacteria bacterium]|nr:AbrB family transcriptional regulator [Pseudomonadota bacterium]
MTATANLLLAITAAAVGGGLAQAAGLPLAWLVGAAVMTAVYSLTVAPVAVPRPAYRLAQLVVGTSVGLTVSSDIAERIGWHIAAIPVGACVSIAIGMLLTGPLVRLGAVDRATAHFAMVPAGISEMADLAGRHGADVGAVATFHAMRVMLVVFLLPPLIFAFDQDGILSVTRDPGAFTLSLATALGCALAAGWGGSRLGLASAWFLGPMAAVAVLSGTGLVAATEPQGLLAAAQIALGLSLGARLKRDTVRRLPRALAAGAVLMLVHALVMGALALALALLAGAEPVTMVLGLATGGSAEMVLTARAVGADAAIVAAYQLSRGLLGNAFAERLHRRRAGQAAGPQERTKRDDDY